MVKTVIKRNGEQVPFQREKIEKAILAAFKEIDGKQSEYSITKANIISKYISELDDEEISVEEIQDYVERGLMANRRKDVAKAYIIYRYRHAVARDSYDQLMNDIQTKISGSDIRNQNANVDEHSFGGRIGETTSMIMKRFALEHCMCEKSRKNHENNIIYIHDLDHYAVGDHNCLSIPFDKLLANGFNTRQTSVRPAKSVSTAFQLVAVIFQLQSLQQFGGVSATHLDWTMVPYVRLSFFKHWRDGLIYCEGLNNNEVTFYPEDSINDKHYTIFERAYKYALDMTKREIYQAVEGMYHNLNTLQSRSGNQLKRMAG